MPSRRRLIAAMLSVAVALPVASAAVTTGAAAATCSVTNARTGATVTSLRTAIKNAKAGDALTVRGTCTGPFTIAKNLKLTGAGTAPTLKGGASGAVVTVAAGAKVTIALVTITGGKGAACVDWVDFICGGGVLNRGKLTLDRVVVRDNDLAPTSARDSLFAGGIYNTYQGTLLIKASTIRDNTATTSDGWAQGAGIGNEGVLVIQGSTISGNTTSGETESGGAGIYNAGTTTEQSNDAVGSLTISNSTISGNVATTSGSASLRGGGIFNEGSAETLVLQYVTISDNSAEIGGGVHSAGPLHLIGALIAGNTASNSPDCLGGATLTATNTLLGVNDGCGITVGGDTGNKAGGVGAVLDAKLGSLAKNGGRTRTHALLAGSPALDAAGDAPCYFAKDQRGVTRPKGDACDIGAFEKG